MVKAVKIKKCKIQKRKQYAEIRYRNSGNHVLITGLNRAESPVLKSYIIALESLIICW